MSDPQKLTLHEGDVTWFIELYTAAAIEWLSLLMTVAKTNHSNKVQQMPLVHLSPLTQSSTASCLLPEEIWRMHPFGEETGNIQLAIRHALADPSNTFSNKLEELAAHAGAMAWRYDTDKQEVTQWTTQSPRYLPAVHPPPYVPAWDVRTVASCLRTVNAFLVKHTSQKYAPPFKTKQVHLYTILLDHFASKPISTVDMSVFDAFGVLHATLFERIQSLVHTASQSMQQHEPGAHNKQWAQTLAMISTQLKRTKEQKLEGGAERRYNVKILLEFFGAPWGFSPGFRVRGDSHSSRKSAQALVNEMSIRDCTLQRKDAGDFWSFFPATEVGGKPGKTSPLTANDTQESSQVLSIVALALAVVAVLLCLGGSLWGYIKVQKVQQKVQEVMT